MKRSGIGQATWPSTSAGCDQAASAWKTRRELYTKEPPGPCLSPPLLPSHLHPALETHPQQKKWRLLGAGPGTRFLPASCSGRMKGSSSPPQTRGARAEQTSSALPPLRARGGFSGFSITGRVLLPRSSLRPPERARSIAMQSPTSPALQGTSGTLSCQDVRVLLPWVTSCSLLQAAPCAAFPCSWTALFLHRGDEPGVCGTRAFGELPPERGRKHPNKTLGLEVASQGFVLQPAHPCPCPQSFRHHRAATNPPQPVGHPQNPSAVGC